VNRPVPPDPATAGDRPAAVNRPVPPDPATAGDRPAAVPPSGFAPTLPAWAEAFAADHRADLRRIAPFGSVDRAWAFGPGDGAGITVAVIDSGVEGTHPALGGALRESVRVEVDGEDTTVVEDDAVDLVGHGTACAGIVHELAPAASLVSVRVLGSDNRGKGLAFAAGLDWAIARGASVVNLSLSSRSEAMYATLHDLADRAYFANCLLVCAANNVAIASYPSLFAAVVSVAAHDVRDAETWFYNPRPPVEFGAYGLDVEVAWRDGSRIVATGNSFAAPHIAGLAARIRAAHPGATPFEVKTILAATATQPG
jgi:subtilisin family serine protease